MQWRGRKVEETALAFRGPEEWLAYSLAGRTAAPRLTSDSNFVGITGEELVPNACRREELIHGKNVVTISRSSFSAILLEPFEKKHGEPARFSCVVMHREARPRAWERATSTHTERMR